jgi:hypothetical protein
VPLCAGSEHAPKGTNTISIFGAGASAPSRGHWTSSIDVVALDGMTPCSMEASRRPNMLSVTKKLNDHPLNSVVINVPHYKRYPTYICKIPSSTLCLLLSLSLSLTYKSTLFRTRTLILFSFAYTHTHLFLTSIYTHARTFSHAHSLFNPLNHF